jgi:hypothetical protein
MKILENTMIKGQKQSSRAPFITRRDAVKLHIAHYVRGKNKVAAPPSYPQLTTIKLVSD